MLVHRAFLKRNTGKIAVYKQGCIEVRKTKTDSHGRLYPVQGEDGEAWWEGAGRGKGGRTCGCM